MKRFWCRFLQPTADHRPLNYPPGAAVLGWWCSGYKVTDSRREDGGLDTPILCALVKAESVEAAQLEILKDWPEADVSGSDSFVNQVPDGWAPGDRFPLSMWMAERIRGAA